MHGKPLKVGVVFNNYGPYHVARLQGAQAQCSQLGWTVVGLELFRSDGEYPWRVDLETVDLPILTAIAHPEVTQVSLWRVVSRVWSLLGQVNPDALAIAGYAQPGMVTALVWGRWHRRPVVLMSESTAADFPRQSWREGVKGWVVKQYQAALVGGRPQARYLHQLGMSESHIFTGYDVVGNEPFHPDGIGRLARPVDRPYFLVISRFVPKKNLLLLLDAYHDYRQVVGVSAWDLVLCGDGPLRESIHERIITLGLTGVVHCPGFLQQSDLLPYFAHGECLVHASTQEQWGLVVNEAMAAGLPVLLSNACGCYEDLLLEGITGFGFDPHNRLELRDGMVRISTQLETGDRQRMGQAALEHIQQFSPQAFGNGLVQALTQAIGNRSKPM